MYYEEVDGNLCLCGPFYMVLHANDENWKALLKENSVSWNFDKDGDVSMIEIGEWCDENLKEEWIVSVPLCGFHSADDAMAFKMRWL